jgi:muconate cycloisomerase
MAAAAATTDHRLLKLKMDRDQIIERVTAVRRARPDASLMLDANESWDLETLQRLAFDLHELGVILIEQPVKRGTDATLADYAGPVPLAADESLATIEDIEAIGDAYSFANIKLDKCGGLTAALDCADALQTRGIRLMVGCLGGSTCKSALAVVLVKNLSARLRNLSHTLRSNPIARISDHAPSCG